jgi:methanogenic corrinoid protein MtbC1
MGAQERDMTALPRSNGRSAARLSIGALSKATGVPVETLRTWESRYGYPVPDRKPSGHRLYPIDSIPRLRRIAEALARGHRAGQVVGASDGALNALLGETAPPPSDSAGPGAPVDVSDLVRLVRSYDAEGLTRALVSSWARLGPIEFLESRVAPLLKTVGTAWHSGELEIGHEHLASERVSDLLRSLRLPFEDRARGPLVVLATLPGELHGLGLQMASLVLSWVGLRVLSLGTDVPLRDVAALARDMSARAVAVSVSLAGAGAAAKGALTRLREMLPRRTALLVGGDGAAAEKPDIEVVSDLRALEAWARRVLGAVGGK